MVALTTFPDSVSESEQERIRRVVAVRQTSAPVDVVAIARDLGINVFSTQLAPGISGILRPRDPNAGPSGYVILVNDSHPANRKRFTVAHEIGHFVLHRDRVRDGIEDDEFYRALPGPLEREANEFAADLLMPWGLINQLQNEGVFSLDQLANRLFVSKQALAIRLGLPYDQDWR